MADYIDRQAAIDEAYAVIVDDAVYDVVQVETLEGLPSADVQPIRNGKWIPKFNGQFKGGAYWFDCSVCGRIVPDVRNGGWNYCPNCGARQDGEQDGTD